MIEIGRPNTLSIVRFAETGAYMDGGPYGEILLPNRYVPENCKEDDELEVFISFDSEDRIVATTDMPKAMVGDFALLEVVDVNNVGAFLDWGLPKDLFVPFKEQVGKLEKDMLYVVRVYVDKTTERIAASCKLNKFLETENILVKVGEEVDIIVAEENNLGFQVIVNNRYSGLIYENELFKKIDIGDTMKGYVHKIREDGKIDIRIEKPGYQKVDPIASELLTQLKAYNGVLPLSDKSDPEIIKRELGISKKTFKKAIGALYRSKLIIIEKDKIRLK